MREIKFRGKALKDCPDYHIKKGDWVKGYLVKTGKECYIVLTKKKLWEFGAIIAIEVDCKTVGEYIGFRDNDGEEIYEGDIVSYKYGERFCEDENEPEIVKWYKDVVKFQNGEFFPHPCIYYNWEDCWYSFKRFDFEVIGNIYDNSELLKGGKK